MTPLRKPLIRQGKIVTLAICIAISEASCKSRKCEDYIGEEIKSGMPIALVKANLQRCGFMTITDPAKKTLYADKNPKALVVSERTQVSVDFDDNNRVVKVVVTKSLTGP